MMNLEVPAVLQGDSGAAAVAEAPAEPPKPAAFTDIMQMMAQGKTIPGIRVCPNPEPVNFSRVA